VLTVFVKNARDEAIPALPQLGALPGMTAATCVSRAKDGPFVPLPVALAEDAALREAFAAGLELPLVERWARARLWLLLGLVPLLMLAELDRELSNAGFASASRLALDALLLAVASLDLARRLPRHPRTTALLLFAGAARYLLFVARGCASGVHPTIVMAPIVAVTAGGLLLRHAPAPTRVTAAVLERLGISDADVAKARAGAAPKRAHVAAAALAAAGMPLALFAARALGLWGQAIVFVAYAAAAPIVVDRVFEPGARLGPHWWPRGRARACAAGGRILPAALVGFALTVGTTSGAHYAFDAGAYATRCVSSDTFESSAKRVLDLEGKDVAKNVRLARESWAYFVMSVLVVPLAEERVFRALLQRVLVRRFGESRGIALAALGFGLAHLGVYKVAVYQTVLLGVGFGAAYAGGGYLAAVLVHVAWNVHLVL
jgi:membrane protease YdiL (CAAX protease family)